MQDCSRPRRNSLRFGAARKVPLPARKAHRREGWGYASLPGKAGKSSPAGKILYICSQVYCQKKMMSNKIPEENLTAGAPAQKYLLTNPVAVV
jgi:hypothetical protein